jgi:hypothetical protein
MNAAIVVFKKTAVAAKKISAVTAPGKRSLTEILRWPARKIPLKLARREGVF